MSTNPASDTTPSSSTLPTDVFEGVAPSLVRLVQTIYREDENATQHKQSVAAATNDFKQRMARAREVVEKLPGGEMSLSDQDEVIAMLKTLRDEKKRQLEAFSTYGTIGGSPSKAMDEGV